MQCFQQTYLKQHKFLQATQVLLKHLMNQQQICQISTSKTKDQSAWEGFYGAQTQVTKSLWQQRLEKMRTTPSDAKLPEVNISKKPEYTQLNYPFATNFALTEEYMNPWGYMRVGKLLEDLDSLAANIAFGHVDDDNPETGVPLLVTASVDKIEIGHPLRMDQDVTMGGQVVWTGKSSLDIRMELFQPHEKEASVVAMFTFVSRHPVTKKAFPINTLIPQTDQEQQWFEEREEISLRRKAERAKNQDKEGEMSIDQNWMQQILKQAGSLVELPALANGDSILMKDTCLSNTFVCQRQQRNMHGRIFGGFLMKRAYELAFSTAYKFCGSRPQFVSVDQISFHLSGRRWKNVGI
eukprot:TRINITY_DN8480_c1_g1_i2.p1 TRINITY_DN8480_c1_g1~~TRINITY_DN8480_c1_g1_i2.p1  ORF type:complete len:352 (-),score=45.42 TRINITY_DN8480_c1_g1_i2:303-1358(-)